MLSRALLARTAGAAAAAPPQVRSSPSSVRRRTIRRLRRSQSFSPGGVAASCAHGRLDRAEIQCNFNKHISGLSLAALFPLHLTPMSPDARAAGAIYPRTSCYRIPIRCKHSAASASDASRDGSTGNSYSASRPCEDFDALVHLDGKMDLRKMYRFLGLQSFSEEEIDGIFDTIYHGNCKSDDVKGDGVDGQLDLHSDAPSTNALEVGASDEGRGGADVDDVTGRDMGEGTIDHHAVKAYLVERVRELEAEHPRPHSVGVDDGMAHSYREDVERYASEQAALLLDVFQDVAAREPLSSAAKEDASSAPSAVQPPANTPPCRIRVSKSAFRTHIRELASNIDSRRTIPISISMLLVGSSVGIVTPVMPFVVENLGLSPGQYGLVVSAFALAKIASNIPSAILVERHGRKPYLVNSLLLVSVGVGGIGLATQFEHLFCCRLLTGLGVAAFSTAATMTMADISTPLNRASTMAPIMSSFAAGMAFGPAVGGLMADHLGISETFFVVGASYLGLTAVNNALLVETKTRPMAFPWHGRNGSNADKGRQIAAIKPGKMDMEKSRPTMMEATRDAVGQWTPLMADARVRNTVVMNGFYWIALAGSQMTILPLMLTDPTGLALSATAVGKTYMGMSLVQVAGVPLMAKFVDKVGKPKAIVAGTSLITSSMIALPFCDDIYQMAGALGVWALGSSILSTAPVSYVSDVVSEDKRAQALALLRTAGDVGFLMGASGVGAVADLTGNLDTAMHTSAGILLTATGWFAARRVLSDEVNKQQQ